MLHFACLSPGDTRTLSILTHLFFEYVLMPNGEHFMALFHKAEPRETTSSSGAVVLKLGRSCSDYLESHHKFFGDLGLPLPQVIILERKPINIPESTLKEKSFVLLGA
jgi:hypothetical protein